ncbi:MAG: helix-turn-helix transcriptional regulator [Prevotella sp.]|jgi:transcriptional regulator with XRE-family HTH domain|nr:helix-turn-helix transcriptional regulator [Prevotella sp.]
MHLRIKEICKEKGISLGDLAINIGIARENLSKLVNGKSKPSIDTFERIALALEVPISDLFDSPRSDAFTCPNCGARLEVRERK